MRMTKFQKKGENGRKSEINERQFDFALAQIFSSPEEKNTIPCH